MFDVVCGLIQPAEFHVQIVTYGKFRDNMFLETKLICGVNFETRRKTVFFCLRKKQILRVHRSECVPLFRRSVRFCASPLWSKFGWNENRASFLKINCILSKKKCSPSLFIGGQQEISKTLGKYLWIVKTLKTTCQHRIIALFSTWKLKQKVCTKKRRFAILW